MKKRFFVLIILILFVCNVNAEQIHIKTVSQDGFTAKFNLENEQKPGLIIEILRAIEKIDPGIKFTGLETKATTARIESMLTDGAIDTFFGLAKTPERESMYNILDPPLYITFQCLVVRADDNVVVKSFDDIKKLGKEGVILVVPGTTQFNYLSTIDGLILDNGSKSAADNLQKLANNRGRFYYGSDINTFDEIENQGMQSKVKILPVRFQEAPICGVISKKAPANITQRLQADYQKLITSGEITKIYKKYFR